MHQSPGGPSEEVIGVHRGTTEGMLVRSFVEAKRGVFQNAYKDSVQDEKGERDFRDYEE